MCNNKNEIRIIGLSNTSDFGPKKLRIYFKCIVSVESKQISTRAYL